MAGHKVVEIPSSNMKKSITEIFMRMVIYLKYKFDDAAGKQGVISIALKYDPVTKKACNQRIGKNIYFWSKSICRCN
jgi:small subunit ribosomal protein S8